MILGDFIALVVSFFAILYGAGLIIKSVDKFSHKLRLSSFSLSFFLLGMLTSIPEFAVGFTSLSQKNPDIFIGNLIGGVAIIFFLVIPLFAVFNGGVTLSHQISRKNLAYCLLTTLAPLVALLDNRITNIEGVALIGVYGLLFYVIERDKGIIDGTHTEILHAQSYSFIDILKILFGVGVVFVSSQIIVGKTILLAGGLGVSTFYISLVILSIGTNLPEFSLAVKSIVLKKGGVAFGDYLGSAAANTFLFGLFSLLSPGIVVSSTSFLKTFIMLGLGMLVLFHFTRSKNNISRQEGLVLLVIYLVFILIELL